MEAVHRYEGTVNQVMGDGIMAREQASEHLTTANASLAVWWNALLGRCSLLND